MRDLRRQFQSGLYERLALSRDKDGIRQLAQQGQTVSRASDLLKEPLVLEFLGLSEQARFSESDLEAAIISQIERFLLELGKGFLFEARQKRFTFDDEHFFVDLVFYNRLLRCYVLIDLKLGKLTHQDLGQMQMYVNYFDRHIKTDTEAATVGIVLCKKKCTRHWSKSPCPKTPTSTPRNTSSTCPARKTYSANWRSGRRWKRLFHKNGALALAA